MNYISNIDRLLIKSSILFDRINCLMKSSLHESFNEARAVLHPICGLSSEKRDRELIVSLTTIPERINKVHLCIETLLRQSVKPNRLILWLSETIDSSNHLVSDKTLPFKLRRLQERGLEIRWYKDIKSLRKIVPTLRLFPQSLVVTADDDVFYPRNWLKQLYDGYLSEPKFIHCHRAHLIKFDSKGQVLPYNQWNITAPDYVGPSLNLFPTGVGGVIYSSELLDSEVLNEDIFLQICPTADDVWLKAMSLLKNTPCKKVNPNVIKLVEIRIPRNRILSQTNVNQNGNDYQISRVSNRYQVFKPDSTMSRDS